MFIVIIKFNVAGVEASFILTSFLMGAHAYMVFPLCGGREFAMSQVQGGLGLGFGGVVWFSPLPPLSPSDVG